MKGECWISVIPASAISEPAGDFNASPDPQLVRFSNWPCWLLPWSKPCWLKTLVECRGRRIHEAVSSPAGARFHPPRSARELSFGYHLALVNIAPSFHLGLLLCLYRGQPCWLTLIRYQVFSGSTQHSAHRLIGGVIALGDLAERLPLRDTLQDSGPLCWRNFEERNGWIAMRLIRWRRL